MKRMNLQIWAAGLAGILGGLAGCRDREPVEAHPYVMKAGDVVLLPTSVSLRDPKILEGTAQVVAIEDRPAMPAHPTGESANPSEGGAASADGATTDIQAMIEEYNALAREGKSDALIDFVPPKLQPLAETMLPLKTAYNELVAAIESKTPGASAALAPITAQMNAMSNEVTISNLTVTGETTATGTMSVEGLPAPVPVNFEKIENDWYMSSAQLPQNVDVAQVKPQVDTVSQELQTITNGIKDGSIDQQQATLRVMASLMKLGSILMTGDAPGAQPPSSDTPPSEPPAAEPTTPPTGG